MSISKLKSENFYANLQQECVYMNKCSYVFFFINKVFNSKTNSIIKMLNVALFSKKK